MSCFLGRRLSCLFAVFLILPAAPALAEPEIYFSRNGGIQDRLLRAIHHTEAGTDRTRRLRHESLPAPAK